MKVNLLIAAMTFCLVASPMLEVSASNNEAVNELLAPAKKKTSKKTTTKKSSSTKKSSTKASSTTTKTTQPVVKTTQSTPATSQTVSNATENTTAKQQAESSHAGSSILGGILSAIGGGSDDNSSESGSILSGLSTIFDATKIASKNSIVGTWTYTEPAVVFSSSNVLKNIGGKVASETIEKQLQTQFDKLGIKKGAMTMTFDKNGNFTQSVGSRTMSGTYTVKGKNVTLKYAGGVQQFVGTTQIDGGDLLIVMDASKLLKYANTLGSLTGNTALKSVGNLLGSMDGMEVGLKLNK